MKAIILCGGQGTRLREHTVTLPKPMVEVGGRPILWHIMKIYAHHGITEFVLCLGYKGELIRNYFLNYENVHSDLTVRLGSRNGERSSIEIHQRTHDEDGWQITLVDTGQHAMTGARVKRAARYLGDADQTFALTYGDGVTDADLSQVLAFHRGHRRLATVTGVRPPSRFGELRLEGDQVVFFGEKPQISEGMINGGFFFLERSFLDYLSEDDDCVLERRPMEKCTADGELRAFPHEGYWQCMDTYRDWERLEQLWHQGRAPWKVWA